MHKKQFLNISEVFQKLSDISNEYGLDQKLRAGDRMLKITLTSSARSLQGSLRPHYRLISVMHFWIYFRLQSNFILITKFQTIHSKESFLLRRLK